MFRLPLRKKNPTHVRAAYRAIMLLSRQPALYNNCGVPDTATSRYEMLMMHMSALFWRLEQTQIANIDENNATILSTANQFRQQIFDLMFADMEMALREMGTGDTGVAKRVKRMAQNFHGRYRAYGTALGTQIEHITAAASASSAAGISGTSDDVIAKVAEVVQRNLVEQTSAPSRSAAGQRGGALAAHFVKVASTLCSLSIEDIIKHPEAMSRAFDELTVAAR